jgi:hypothetical protein
VIRDDLTPEQLALAAAEGQRLADADAARRSAEQPAQPTVTGNVQRDVQHQPVKVRNMTLVALRHFEVEGHVFHHSAEIMPGLLAKETVDKLIDQGLVKEYDSADRTSLYRLFAPFSGCEERDPLSHEELTSYGLPK